MKWLKDWTSLQKIHTDDITYLTSLAIRKIKIKASVYMPVTIAKIKNIDNIKCCQGCGATGTSHTLFVNREDAAPLEKQFGSFLSS